MRSRNARWAALFCTRLPADSESSSSFGAGGPAELSFLGFRPGLGLAGITHSFEAVAHNVEAEVEAASDTGDGPIGTILESERQSNGKRRQAGDSELKL